jgi:hypothetical protein
MDRKRRILDWLGLARYITGYWSIEAEMLERTGSGEEADRARTKADRGLKLQRKIARKLYYPGEVVG